MVSIDSSIRRRFGERERSCVGGMEESAKFIGPAQRFVLETLDGGLQGSTCLFEVSFLLSISFKSQRSQILLYLCDFKLSGDKITQEFLMIVYLQFGNRILAS